MTQIIDEPASAIRVRAATVGGSRGIAVAHVYGGRDAYVATPPADVLAGREVEPRAARRAAIIEDDITDVHTAEPAHGIANSAMSSDGRDDDRPVTPELEGISHFERGATREQRIAESVISVVRMVRS